jgi:glycerol-3-phosphate dehydrogenase
MTRETMLMDLVDTPSWDLVVIGGGATGLGVAVESASRGYRTVLLEQADFGSGTSSRSTKLIHGGVRYLQQGNISLVLEALHERGLLIRNAPHLVHNLSFVVPLYDWWEGPFYGAGLKLYDMLAGKLGLGPSRILSREETLTLLPTVEPEGLRGGVIYHDGQFDDARLAVNLAQTACELGAAVLNYVKVTDLTRSDGQVDGVVAVDQETKKEYRLSGRVVVNAAGPFADSVRRLDDPSALPLMSPSQGVHLVLDRSFLPGESAIMVPHTDDGRVLFAVPWHGSVVVGTTDTPVETVSLEPRPFKEEIDFLLSHASRYLTRHPKLEDILSVFAGIRPLVDHGAGAATSSISRDHTLLIEPSGLVTITGGKWTTYRRMGEDAVTAAARLAGLPEVPSRTADLRIHGWTAEKPPNGCWSCYGSDSAALAELAAERPEWGELLHPSLPYRAVEVVWGVRNEWARTVADVLARRLRALVLDAGTSCLIAPRVATLMAEELGYGTEWIDEQVADYQELARGYLPGTEAGIGERDLKRRDVSGG